MKKKLVGLFMVIALHAHAQDTTSLSLLFLGDIMGHASQITSAFDPVTKRYDYKPCFELVKPYIQGADVAIGNLELTLAGPPYTGYPQFCSPDALAVALKDAGLDVLVTANNHCVDKGRRGLERTNKILDSLAIPHTGTFKNTEEKKQLHPLLIERHGFRLALLNYTFSTNGLPVPSPNMVNMMDTAVMRKDIQSAKGLNPDMIIVFTHWGVEYERLPNAWLRAITKHCFKHGAGLVIGAHPHVIQPMEWDQDKNQLITYSLGNFVSGQRKRFTDGGAMIRINLKKVVSPDTSYTRIDDAGYILEWVYKSNDARQKFVVVPAATGERDTMVMADPASRSAFRSFLRDSRELLGKHNRAIPEWKSAPHHYLIYSGVAPAGILPDDQLQQSREDGTSVAGPFTMEDATFLAERLTRLGMVIKEVSTSRNP